MHSYRYVSEDLKTARGPVRTAINGLVHHTASLYDSLVVRSMTPSLSLPDGLRPSGVPVSQRRFLCDLNFATGPGPDPLNQIGNLIV